MEILDFSSKAPFPRLYQGQDPCSRLAIPLGREGGVESPKDTGLCLLQYHQSTQEEDVKETHTATPSTSPTLATPPCSIT